MKLLCFSDLHRDQAAARQLVERSREADILIGAGDFANKRIGLADTIDILKLCDLPTILVPGNGESADELTEAVSDWPTAAVLHGQSKEVTVDQHTLRLFGIGGGIPVTPFGPWSYDFSEVQAAELLGTMSDDVDVLVSHSPPIDTVDRDSSGQIRGSQSVRDALERVEPRLVICGHIHSDWRQHTAVGSTTVLNAGPEGMLVELNNDHVIVND